MSRNQNAVRSLATAMCRFGDDLDRWIQRNPADAAQKGLRRTSLLGSRFNIRNIEAALAWGPSVGLYGESQCGKSMLVSRFARGLGSGNSDDGSLMITDTTTSESGVPGEIPRWRLNDEAAGASAGIDFAKWIDPRAGRESTGIVCRFSKRRPEGLRDGHFLVQLMSISELLSSLVLGFSSETEEREQEGRGRRLQEVLRQLERDPLEKDREEIMPQLLHAWDFLNQEHVLGRTSQFTTLDNGDQGWDEFVRSCVNRGLRPSISESSQPDGVGRLVSLLWDEVPAITRLWRKLFLESRKLKFARDVMVPIDDVLTDKPRDGRRPSLVAVEWMNRIWSEEHRTTCSVEPLADADHGPRRILSAALVSLARTLVLPVGDQEVGDQASAEASEELDVLDYPGARAETKSLDFDDEEKSPKYAVDALLRGKINRLFVSAVDHFDSSVLCLAVGGTGNLEAPKPVGRALEAWLQRERWSGFEEFDSEPGAPPMVVAMTKSDVIFSNGAPAFEAKVRDLREKYSSAFDWMDDWADHQPFRDIYWVHNPTVDGAIPLGDMPDDERDARIRECLEQPLLEKYTAQPEQRLRAMFVKPPSDVDGLFAAIRSKSDPERRIVELASKLTGSFTEIFNPSEAAYIGAGDGQRATAEAELAKRHVDCLEKALAKTHVVAEFLSALELPARLVSKTYEQVTLGMEADEDEIVESVDFDEIYRAVCAVFVSRFEKAMSRSTKWSRRLDEVDQDLKSELSARFRLIPSSPWFRDEIERAVRPMVSGYDVGRMNVGAFSSAVSAIWNRNMVWLGRIPEAPLEPANRPPKLRSRRAASKSILEHWRSMLPIRYKELFDPVSRSDRSNLELGEIRRSLSEDLSVFLRDVAGIDEQLIDLTNDVERMNARILEAEGTEDADEPVKGIEDDAT